MDNIYNGLGIGILLAILFSDLVINFIYLTNIDLFLNLILFKKKKEKLIKHIKEHY